MEIEDKIRAEYARRGSAKGFEKFLDANPDARIYLEGILNRYAWFENITNVYVGINHGVCEPVKCLHCGRELKVRQAIYGRHRYCCKKCSDSDPVAASLRERTCLERYGSRTPLLNADCRRKSVETCREKYGADHFAGSNEYKRRVPSAFARRDVQEKSESTKRERYGDDWGRRIYEKSKKRMTSTNIEKYGVPFVLMNEDKRQEGIDSMIKKYGDPMYHQGKSVEANLETGWNNIQKWSEYVVPLFTREEYEGRKAKKYLWRCVKCGNEFEQEIYTTGLGESRMVPRCEKCFPLCGSSIAEKEMRDWIGTFYDGEIISRDQSVLGGRKELDIYIPNKKLAIEFDGLYWHSEKCGKGKYYHLNKTLACERRGVRLIHVFEDEWLEKRELVKDRIRTIICGGETRIYARKCEVREIGAREAGDFLDANHIQGSDHSSIRYGLFYENELASVMTFGKPRFNKNYDFELIRFASKLGVQVIGGASRLLAHFREEHSGSIVSYADRRYSTGGLYRALGFEKISESRPNYWWVRQGMRLSRYQCQKRNLPKVLGGAFNESLSESENMAANGFWRMFDCGNLVYALN